MERIRFAGLLTLAVVSTCAVGSAWAFRNVEEGAPAPGFTLATAAGEDTTVAGEPGGAAVVAFVRQGQEKSGDVLGDLAALGPEVAGRTRVFAVVVNPGEGDAGAWAEGHGARYPVLLDGEGSAYGLYGVVVVPSTAVVGPDGTLRAEFSGHTASYRDDLEAALRVALGLATADDLRAESAAESGPAKTEARKDAERRLGKARLLAKRGMREKALPAAREAVSADPTYGEAHVLVGNLLLDASEENADEAAAHFEEALALAPRDADAKVGMARVMGVRGRHEEAAEILRAAALVTPKPEKLYYELGLVYERAGDCSKAVEAYRKALEKALE